MKTGNAIEGSDAAIYPELSRANLLRMRGDYMGAEEQCLAILKRYPNNATVHTLLGDIYAEQDDLEQAAQWYELALDLDPESTVDEQKLNNVRERMRHKETAASAEQLGLPVRKGNVPLMAVVAMVVIVMVTAAAYWVGQRSEAGVAHAPTISKPIDAPVESTGGSDGSTVSGSSAIAGPRQPQIDRELIAVLQQRSPAAGNLVSVLSDPRSHIVTVTYTAGQNEDEKKIGAELARTILEQSQEVLIVTVRAVRDEQIVYMADASRSRIQEIDFATGGDAWVERLMTNEWPAARTASNAPAQNSEAPTSTPPASTPPPSSVPSGTTEPSGSGGPAFSPPMMGGH